MSDSEEKVLYEVPRAKGNGEVIRAAVSFFKGVQMLQVRVWYRTDSGELAPGRNGINLPVTEYAQLRAAVEALDPEASAKAAAL